MWSRLFYPLIITGSSLSAYLYASFPSEPRLVTTGTFEITTHTKINKSNIDIMAQYLKHSTVKQISVYEYESNKMLDCDGAADFKEKFVAAQKLRIQHAKFPWNKILKE